MRNGHIRYRDSNERRRGDRRINDAQIKSRLAKSKVKTQNKLQKKKAVLHPKLRDDFLNTRRALQHVRGRI